MPYKHPERLKEYVAANRQKIRGQMLARAHSAWERIIGLLGGECVDCHLTFRRHIYDLHHLNPATKEERFRPTWSWARIEKYIVGCVLLCANCHRERHYQIREEKIWLRS